MLDGIKYELSIALPSPPSLNNIYFNVKNKGRIKTKVYRLWFTECQYLLLRVRKPEKVLPKNITWSATYNFHFKSPYKSDLDNRIKPLNDLFAKFLGVDDRYCTHIHANKYKKYNLPIEEGDKKQKNTFADCVYCRITIGN